MKTLMNQECFRCNGSGQHHKGVCYSCNGAGQLNQERIEYLIEVQIPDAMDVFTRTKGAKGIPPREGEYQLDTLRGMRVPPV